MEIEEFKKLLFGFQQSQNHQQYEKYYKELTEAFKKLKTENEELNSSLDDYEEANKRLSKQADDMYKLCQKESDKYYILSQENTKLKEKLKEYQKKRTSR